MGGDRPQIALLTADNYAIWKTKMLDRLHVKRMAKPITCKGIEPDDYVLDWEELDRRCLGYIRDFIDPSVYHHVENENTAWDCWSKLQDLYERQTSTHKVNLMKQLGRLRYQDGTSVYVPIMYFDCVWNRSSC